MTPLTKCPYAKNLRLREGSTSNKVVERTDNLGSWGVLGCTCCYYLSVYEHLNEWIPVFVLLPDFCRVGKRTTLRSNLALPFIYPCDLHQNVTYGFRANSQTCLLFARRICLSIMPTKGSKMAFSHRGRGWYFCRLCPLFYSRAEVYYRAISSSIFFQSQTSYPITTIIFASNINMQLFSPGNLRIFVVFSSHPRLKFGICRLCFKLHFFAIFVFSNLQRKRT
jgi:hypothetical protein